LQASVWRFRARAGKEREFESLYGPGGLWAGLFRESPHYHGTVLLRSHAGDRWYVLVDTWRSRADFEAFKVAHAAAYEGMDREGEGLTEAEEHQGWFDELP